MGFIRAITNVIPAMFNLGNIWGGIFKNMDYAFVEDATPDEIVLMLKEEGFGIPDDAWSVTVDSTPATISSITWVGGVVTITLEEEVEFNSKVVVKLKGGGKTTVTNNTLMTWVLSPTGNSSGVATLNLTVSESITVTMDGTALFYSDAAGTQNESDTWSLQSGANRVIYIRCDSETKMKFSDGNKLTRFNSFTSVTNEASLFFDLKTLSTSLTHFTCTGQNTVFGDLSTLPAGLKSFDCQGQNTVFGDLSTLPAGLTHFTCTGKNTVFGDFSTLPAGLTRFNCQGQNTVNAYSTTRVWAANLSRIQDAVATAAIPQADLVRLINDISLTTWIGERVFNFSGGNASLADTSQGGIWGNFDGVQEPSDVAVALKTLVVTKSVTCTFNGISMPGVSGDGTGFPVGFGDWWRS